MAPRKKATAAAEKLQHERGENWSAEEVEWLLVVKKQEEQEFSLKRDRDQTVRKGDRWKLVAERMAQQMPGFSRSPDKVKTKFDNLTQTLRRIFDHNKKSGVQNYFTMSGPEKKAAGLPAMAQAVFNELQEIHEHGKGSSSAAAAVYDSSTGAGASAGAVGEGDQETGTETGGDQEPGGDQEVQLLIEPRKVQGDREPGSTGRLKKRNRRSDVGEAMKGLANLTKELEAGRAQRHAQILQQEQESMSLLARMEADRLAADREFAAGINANLAALVAVMKPKP